MSDSDQEEKIPEQNINPADFLEDKEQIDEINEILNTEVVDATTALNILINAVQVSFDKPHFNDLDRALISKSINCFKQKILDNEDFFIKVS